MRKFRIPSAILSEIFILVG